MRTPPPSREYSTFLPAHDPRITPVTVASLALTRASILLYALASAALYSGLMPAWEGFDELYHFGAVQHLATTGKIAELGKSTLSRELWNSLDYLPVSHYIQPYLERPSMSFEEYFRLAPEQRAALRRAADGMDNAWRDRSSPRVNYEAKQAPLTYFLLAPLEAVLARSSLLTRVLALRLLLSVVTIPLLWIGTRRLAAALGLEGPLEAAMLLVVFSSQMLYAETCRVGNDALTAPFLVWFLWAGIQSYRQPRLRNTARAAILMGLGLLVKSYLLIFLPLALAAPVARWARGKCDVLDATRHTALFAGLALAAAGPWYLRNFLMYGHPMGIDETSGLGVPGLIRAAFALPWAHSIPDMARSFIWTGNNSFVTFSRSTLNLVAALTAASLVLYLLRARRNFAEAITFLAASLYAVLLLGIAVAFFHSSGGLVAVSMPWYAQALLAPLMTLAFVGLSRWGRLGQSVAIATVVLWAYVAAVSWLAKLVPLYGGFEDSHARPGQLLNWYLHGAGQRNSVLANLCPAPLPMIYMLLAILMGTLAVASARVVIAVCRETR